MGRSLSPLTFSALLGVALTWTAPVAAYVPSVTPLGCNPLHWAQTCVYITADSDGSADMPFPELERVARESVQSWSALTAAKSFLWLEYTAGLSPRNPSLDGWQVIKFRAKTWCRPADASGDAVCYDPGAAALTTVSFVNDPDDPENDGRIVDADIELNAVANYFHDAVKNPKPNAGSRRPLDLSNTLTHELGHLLGLEHTCSGRSAQRVPSCSRTGDGQPVVACSVVETGRATDPQLAAIYETTMYPSAKAGEISKRTPEEDDVAAIAALYPTASDPSLCGPPGTNAGPKDIAPLPSQDGASDEQGCAITSNATSPAGWTWLASLTAFCVLRRRRARD
ncbi:MAG TPA: hypothetical protein VI072_27245 [Polyangiaceae bacterium]